MKIRLTLLLCVVTSAQLYSQAVTRQSIVGEWICRDVSFSSEVDVNDPNMKHLLEVTKKGFINSIFSFTSQGVFNLKLQKDAGEIMKNIELANEEWFFNQHTQRISIGTPQENLMHIEVKAKDGFLVFMLYETPVVLKMEKRIK